MEAAQEEKGDGLTARRSPSGSVDIPLCDGKVEMMRGRRKGESNWRMKKMQFKKNQTCMLVFPALNPVKVSTWVHKGLKLILEVCSYVPKPKNNHHNLFNTGLSSFEDRQA